MSEDISSELDPNSIPSRPTFIYRSFVHSDDLDSLKFLHSERFIVHVERAITAFYRSLGLPWDVEVEENPDQFQVVQQIQTTFPVPFRGTGELIIQIWVERLGESSCVYEFVCTSKEGQTVYARGTKTVVKVDPATMEPTPWSEPFNRGHLPLL
jgi:acyl-CoA thioester hydrolase